MRSPDLKEIGDELIRALSLPERPPRSEGWWSMEELTKAVGVSPTSVRRRMAGKPVERKKHIGFMFYRLKNGKL